MREEKSQAIVPMHSMCDNNCIVMAEDRNPGVMLENAAQLLRDNWDVSRNHPEQYAIGIYSARCIYIYTQPLNRKSVV